MALFDHRVFKYQGDWWVAQVHGGTGVAWGDASPRITHERVLFTKVGSDGKSPATTSEIPAGWLNQLSHESIVRVIEMAVLFSDDFPMAPVNAPSVEEFEGAIHVDEEGLRWAARSVQAVRLDPNGDPGLQDAMELVCLDDSALRKEVRGAELSTLVDFEKQFGELGMGALVTVVKSTYRDFKPQGWRPGRSSV